MLRAALFDLGETLITYGDEPTILRLYLEGLEDLYEHLAGRRRELPDWALFRRRVTRSLKWNYLAHRLTSREMVAADVARRVLAGMGLEFGDEEFQSMCRITFGHIRNNFSCMEFAAEVLEAVRGMGLRMGILSNVVVPSFLIEEDLVKHGLRDFFEVRHYSVDLGRRKPAKCVFRKALGTLGVKPSEALFVGDRRYTDIWGASRVGMPSVLVLTGAPGRWPLGRPEVVLENLEGLPAFIEQRLAGGR